VTAAAFVAAAVSSEARPQSRPASLELLDVPFVAQSEALCGGAAAAMVMRYWGATGVYAESFADLVDGDAGGIRGDALLRSLQGRGWDARAFRGDPAALRSHLAQRRPVVALIEDRPGRFHYVVVVAWPDGRVLLHDPARAPFRVLTEPAFTRAWEAAGYWTMLVLPASTGAAALPAPPPDAAADTRAIGAACAPMVQEGITLATAGDVGAAGRLFLLAADACPRDGAPWREMAGLHALRREWREAAASARRATSLDPADRHAWRILATASFLDGDERAALGAWNRIGEPTVDLVEVKGLDRTRYKIVADATAIEPQSILTSAALERARRRLREVPSVQAGRVAYHPAENGRALVDVVVFERPMMPTSAASLVAAGVRAVSEREVAVALASPTGGGETWSVAWRWWERRPRVAFGFAAPVAFGGVLRIDAYDERQTYGSAHEERRRGASVGLADWLRADTRWTASAGLDRWRDRGASASIGVGLDRHAGDAFVISARATAWPGLPRTWTASAQADWRSSREYAGHVWSARAGLDLAGARAPFALWHGAGSGPRSNALLRAHPILDDGRVEAAVFGRRLIHAGAEWRRWLPPVQRVVRIAPALFADAGRASRGAAFSDTRAHVDVGAGLRFVVPGAGVVGVDVGRGLRDGNMALSIGWRR
jgi:hypothetical protein